MSDEIRYEDKRVIGRECPVFRVSFEHMHEPQAYEGQDPKYSLVMLFDRKTTNIKASKLWAAATAAAKEKWGAKFKLGPKGEWPAGFKCPFRNGDEKKDTQPAYEGMVFAKASSKEKPPMFDQGLIPIMNDEIGKEKFYSGCYAKASLTAFAYDVSGNRGVSFAVTSVQTVKHGDKLGRVFKAENEFDAVDSSDESSEEVEAEEESNMGF